MKNSTLSMNVFAVYLSVLSFILLFLPSLLLKLGFENISNPWVPTLGYPAPWHPPAPRTLRGKRSSTSGASPAGGGKRFLARESEREKAFPGGRVV